MQGTSAEPVLYAELRDVRVNRRQRFLDRLNNPRFLDSLFYLSTACSDNAEPSEIELKPIGANGIMQGGSAIPDSCH